MHLTVVICTHNRVNLLKRTIESLNRAKRPKECTIQLLIIPNACTDDTINVLQKYIEHYSESNNNIPLQFIEEPNVGKSHALNKAIDNITKGFICFIDDDHRVDSEYFYSINKAIAVFQDASIFCGKIIPDWTGNEPDWIHETGEYKIYPLPVPHFELGTKPLKVENCMKLPGGGNIIVSLNIFKKIGNFSTSLGPVGHNLAGSEDSDFILRCLNANVVIRYIPEIIQFHHVDKEHLKLQYLIIKSFQRSRTISSLKLESHYPAPRWLWRKLLVYIYKISISFSSKKRRFYLMRIASTLGEIASYKKPSQ